MLYEVITYGFSNGLRLDVPGDFNSQLPELKYYEGNVWYQRYFTAGKTAGKRTFIYFAGVSYQAKVLAEQYPLLSFENTQHNLYRQEL